MTASIGIVSPNNVHSTSGIFSNQAMQLLDFSQKLDISLLDSVVNCFYGSVGEEVRFIYCCLFTENQMHTLIFMSMLCKIFYLKLLYLDLDVCTSTNIEQLF